MLNDEPAGSSRASISSSSSADTGNKMEIKETLMEKSNQEKQDANQNQNRSVADIRNKRKMNATHVNEIESVESDSKITEMEQNANNQNFNAPHELIQNDEHEGEEVEIIEDISIQNDEISNERTIDLIEDEENVDAGKSSIGDPLRGDKNLKI